MYGLYLINGSVVCHLFAKDKYMKIYDKEYKKESVEKYLDQIKILSALATALLLAPSAIQTILQVVEIKL